MARLSGRAAIVTGGAKGIGRHYSRALVAEGARVMIADIADGRGLAEEIAAEHGANSVITAVADVSDEASVKKLVAATMERAASNYRDGEIVGFEEVARYVTTDLVCLAEVERWSAKVAGRDDVSAVDLRVTSVFRLEEGTWKIVNRHADPITTPWTGESVIRT